MISVIRNNKNMFGLNIGLNKSYIIGFEKRHHAHLVKLQITNNPDCHLLRSKIHNITNDVKNGLLEFGIVDNNITQINIDVEAKLSIMKKKNIDKIDYSLEIEDIKYDDFLMIPIIYNMGIILPYELILEDDNKLEFKSQVIESLDDELKTIKNNLNKLLEL